MKDLVQELQDGTANNHQVDGKQKGRNQCCRKQIVNDRNKKKKAQVGSMKKKQSTKYQYQEVLKQISHQMLQIGGILETS